MKDLRWGWILLGALLANVAIALLITPIALLDGAQHLGYVAPPLSFIGVLALAYWIARKAPQRAALHGLLVGLGASVIYVPILLAGDITFAHLLSSALKTLGGAAGGLLVARRVGVKSVAT